ncbi:MAG: hypothetical protein QOI88_3363 [Gammaproteobacteria bacterium]|jgi:hypothetical protein|nr:hypothetical protein [Gammaproteobacteria bacterium]
MGLSTGALVALGAAIIGSQVSKGHGGAVAGLFGNSRPVNPSLAKQPTTDTAANDSMQQQQQMARQKGVLATIFAGNSASAPTVKSNTLLGGGNTSLGG